MEYAQSIKKYRQAKKLTQRQLAGQVETSQQHIQRLETGVSPVQLHLAVRIAEALDQPLGKVFPALAPLLKKYKGKKAEDEEIEKAFEDAGVETDIRIWTIEFGLRSGPRLQYTMQSKERKRLENILNDFESYKMLKTDIPYFWFDSEVDSVIVNLDAVEHLRVMYDPPRDTRFNKPEEIEEVETVRVWTRGREKPLEFVASEDPHPDPNLEEGEIPEGAELRNMLHELEMNFATDGFVKFTDEDGEAVYIRSADIALMAVPLWNLNPELLYSDDDDEIEAEELGKADSESGQNQLQDSGSTLDQ